MRLRYWLNTLQNIKGYYINLKFVGIIPRQDLLQVFNFFHEVMFLNRFIFKLHSRISKFFQQLVLIGSPQVAIKFFNMQQRNISVIFKKKCCKLG